MAKKPKKPATKKSATKKPAAAKSAKKSATKLGARPAKTSATRSAKKPATKPAKRAAAKPAKKRAKPAAKKPAAVRAKPLTFQRLRPVPPLALEARTDRAFEIVYQPEKLRPLATATKQLEGHSQFVQGLAFSPDGAQLVTGSEDSSIRVWNVADGTCVKTLTDHGSAVNGVAFTADGTRLLSASDDYSVKVWSVPAYEVVRTLEGHTDYVSKVFPAGPGRAVSSSKDGTLRLWDLETGECLRVMDHGGWVFAMGVSHDGKRAIASSDRNVMRTWDLATGTVERVLLDASGDYIGEVMGMTLSAPNRTGVGHKDYPKQVVFAPDDASFLSSADDVIEWETETGAERGRTDGDGWPIAGIAYIPDRASTLRAHGDPDERAFVDQLERAPNDRDARLVYGDWLEDRGRLAEANSVRRHGAFRYVFAGSRDAVHVFDLGLQAIVAQAAWDHGGDVHNVAVSPDGRLAASGSADGVVGLWEIDALLRAGMPDRHLSRPSTIAISPDGIALTGTSDRTVRLWAPNGARNERLPPSNGLFATVKFTPDGRDALVMSDKGVLQVFDAKTAELRGTARFDDEGSHHPFSESTFLADGRLLVGATSGPLAIWPIAPPSAPTAFAGEAGQVCGLALAEDADLVVTTEYASGSDPIRIKWWSLATRTLTRELAFKTKVAQYGTSVSIVDRGTAMRVAVTTSEGGLLVLDGEGELVYATKLSDNYLNEVMLLPDGTLVIANSGKPILVDVRKPAVLAQLDWGDDKQVTLIAGTSRAVVTSPEGVAQVDFATRTLWAPTPTLAATHSVAASLGGAFVVATSSNDELAGVPVVLRLR